MKQLEIELAVCMRCGMCQTVCPLFAETGRESDVARGKLALLDGLIEEAFKDPAGVAERLARCLFCGSCAADCPSGVRILDIFIRARAMLTAYMGLHPVKRIVLRGLLARPGLLDRFLEWSSRLQGALSSPADGAMGTSCSRFPSLYPKRRFKPLAPVPFHRLVNRPDSPAGISGLKAGIFVGCLIDKIYPEVAQAMVRSLELSGVSIFVPRSQGCCGSPALGSGDIGGFSTLVAHNLRLFPPESFDVLVTGCATCTWVIRKIWPLMGRGLSTEEIARVKILAGKTRDVSEFLVDGAGPPVGDPPSGKGRTLLTYHDPCHLRKSLKISAQPRTLLQTSAEYTFREMAEADRCCGCGGSFNLRYYEISSSIGRRKVENILRSGCSTVATGCPACMLHITDVLSRIGSGIRVKHTIEIYAEGLDAR